MSIRLSTAAGALVLGLGLAPAASDQMQPGMRKGMRSERMTRKGLLRDQRVRKRQGSM